MNNQNTMSLDDLKQQLFSYDATPDDDGVIYMSEVVDGVEVATSRTRIEGYIPKRDVRGSQMRDLLRNNALRPISDKLSSELAKVYSKNNDSEDSIEVVVTFVDDLKLPFLEDYDYNLSLSDSKNVNIKKRNNDAIELLSRIRKVEIDEIIERFPEEYLPIKVIGYDKVSKFVELVIRVRDIDYLLSRDDVQYIELLHEYAEMEEKVGGNLGVRSGDNIVDGRGLINSDAYYSYNSGRIAILDSSVDTSHVLLSGRFGVIRDCVRC